jgi:hypothetical protein
MHQSASTSVPFTTLGGLACALSVLLGCQQKMADQPSYKPLDSSDFFADGRSARLPVAGTVARGHLHTDRALYTGRISGERHSASKSPAANDADKPAASVKRDGGIQPDDVPKPDAATEPAAMAVVEREFTENNDFVEYFPLEVTAGFVEHGRERYLIFCVVCHDPLGTGQGKVVERGYTRPPSYHIERLRRAPVGRLFAVVTEGYGSMPSYAEQISVRDRWAIAAYVRALQLSQHFPVEDVPAELERKWSRRADVAAEGVAP